MSSTPTSNIFLDVDGSNVNGGGGSIIFNTSASAGTASGYNAKITGTREGGGTGGDSRLGFWTTLVSSSTAPQERMTITKEGNVGIGTTSPSAKLNIIGDVHIGNYTDTNDKNLELRTPSAILAVNTSASASVGTKITYSWANGGQGPLKINNAGGEVIRIASNGNVGIGTTTPSSDISVNATVLEIQDNNIASLALNHGTTGKFEVAASGLGLYFGHSGNSKMVIQSGGNVGIGTTSPSYKLSVSDSVNNADVGIHINNSFDDNLATSNPNAVVFLNAASNNGYLRVHGAPANTAAKHQIDLGSTAGSSFLTFSPSGSERMRITSGGNVGIGQTNPQSLLHVGNGSGVILSAGLSTWADNAVLSNGWTSGVGDWLKIEVPSGDNESGFIQLNSNGNVGIGTTSPSSKLEVAGNALLDGKVYINANASIPSRTEEFQVTGRQIITNTGTDGPSLDLGYNSSGSVRLQLGRGRTADGLAYMDFNGEVMPAGSYGFRIIRNSGANAVTQLNQVGTGNLQINASNGADTVFTNTNVGIGTTSPAAKLEVQGSAPFIYITDDTETESGIIFRDLQADMGQAAAIKFSSSDNKLRFYNNDTAAQRMVIDTAGKVGIGTDSPDANLDVEAANPRIRLTSSKTGISDEETLGAIDFYTSDASSLGQGVNAKIEAFADDIYGRMGLRFYTGESGSPTERMRIVSGGNVGIGTTTPDYKLEVDGTLGVSRTDGIIFAGSAGSGQGNKITSDTSNNLIFSTSLPSAPYTTTEKVRILNNGNVGIGNTSPGYKLDVLGNARFTGGLVTSSSQTRDKISVWNSLGSYTIGMKNGFGYGGLGGDSTGTDYAMSFQMSNTTNRGWWWGDTAHTDLQGAMSLTTQGKLVVATSIKVGAGESTRSAGTSKLTVVAPLSSGGIGTDFQIDGGSGFGMKNVQVEIPAYGDGIRFNSVAASSVDNNAVTFYQDANKRGSIIVNATSTSYNTTSDYRLKENKEDISDAIERVKALNPVKFNWISEPNKPKVDGFYAHELAEVVPEAVTGEKDAIDHENNPDYQSIDQSKIVPLLSAALQQAIDKIEELEQRIQLIENK